MNPEYFDLIYKAMAEASITFNSIFTVPYKTTDIHGETFETELRSYFYPTSYSFGQDSKIEVYCWKIEKAKLAHLNIRWNQQLKMSNSKHLEFVEIILPKYLDLFVKEIESKFGKPHEVFVGYLNPGGRSAWVFPNHQQSFGIKFHSVQGSSDQKYINRPLTSTMLEQTYYFDKFVDDDDHFLEEGNGLHISWKDQENEFNYGYLLRQFKHNKQSLLPGDVLLPMYSLFSDNFWQNKRLLEKLGLSDFSDIDRRIYWLVNNLAGHFSKMMSKAIFKNGIHLECHQQNLTILLRKQNIEKIYYHDLQDCLLDPVTRLCQGIISKNLSISEQITELTKWSRNNWAKIGEIVDTKDSYKAIFSVHSWWRRWFKILGQYDYTINAAWLGNPHLIPQLEEAVRDHFLKEVQFYLPDFDFANLNLTLFQLMAIAHFEYQQKLIKQVLSKLNFESSSLKTYSEWSENSYIIASFRAPAYEQFDTFIQEKKVIFKVANISANQQIGLLSEGVMNHFYIKTYE